MEELRIWSDAKSTGHPTKGGDMLGMTALRLERTEAGVYRVYAYDRICTFNDGKPIGLVGHQEGGWTGLTSDLRRGIGGDTPYATPDEVARRLYDIYMDRRLLQVHENRFTDHL